MKEGRKPEYPEKTPGAELQKMPHIPKPEDSSPKRASNPHTGGRLGKQTCPTVTPRVAPTVSTVRSFHSKEKIMAG